jgi:hypothetical protein
MISTPKDSKSQLRYGHGPHFLNKA